MTKLSAIPAILGGKLARGYQHILLIAYMKIPIGGKMQKIIALALLGVLGLTSCQYRSEKRETSHDAHQMRIVHKLGESHVDGHPVRVVTLDIGKVETIHELGLTPVGIPKRHLP